MSNDERPKKSEARMSNEAQVSDLVRHSDFGILSDFVIRPSDLNPGGDGSAELPVKHHSGDDEPHAGDDLANMLLGDALRVMRAQEIAGHRARRHHERLRPVDQAREYEVDRRDLVDEGTEDRLEEFHLGNVGQAQVAKRSQHKDADAGPKIPAVNGHKKLEQD